MKDSAEEFLLRHADPCDQPILLGGRIVDGWRIVAFLGRGGSGEVYRVATDSMVAALKVLVRDTGTAHARFVREASILAKMDNPAFPQFIAQGEVDGRPYFVTELLEPRNLPSSDAEVANFLLKLCVGVAALHRMGYVHRDIKPGNILWRPCVSAVPVLIDLGLVKDVTRDHASEGTSLTLIDGHAAGVGTPGYAAPEQLVGDTISPTADIHALGMLANECFGGKPSPVWGRIIDRATGSIPTRRYRDIAAFARAVRHRHWRWSMILGTALLIGVCGIVSAFLLFAKRREPPHPLPVSSATPAMFENALPSVTERRRELVRKINEKSMASRAYAQKASKKMDEISTETERLFTVTDNGERATIVARLKRLQSERDEYVRLQIAATNGIDTLQNELKTMSDFSPPVQVTQ